MRIELVLEDASLSVAEEFAIAREIHRKRHALKRARLCRYQRSNASKGLCTNCPRQPERGKRKCKACLRKSYECNKAWRLANGRRKAA